MDGGKTADINPPGQSNPTVQALFDSRQPDTGGTLADPAGLDIAALIALKDGGHSLREHSHGQKLQGDAIIDIPCDIWIPAARPDVINAGNVSRLQTRLVAQGANIPCTQEAEQALHQRGVLALPDFIANAGGVICAAMEYQGATEKAAFEYIDERIRANTRTVSKRPCAKTRCRARPRWRSPREECAKPLQRAGGAEAEAFRAP